MPKTARLGAQNLTVLVCIDDDSPMKLLTEADQFGSPLLVPNTRALMLEATHFENMQATVPICKASRASMFAAKTPMRTKVWNNEDDDSELMDFTTTWPALFKALGQVDGIGKLSHEVTPQQAVIDACYTRMHVIDKNAITAVTINSQSGISGTAGQVFEQVRLLPKNTADSGAASAYCNITLNGAGNAIATVTMVEKRDVSDLGVMDVAPRYEMGASGKDATVGDTYEIEGLGYDPVTLEYSMPLARCVVEVDMVTSFWRFADEGVHEYGTFTEAATVLKGDALIVEYADQVFAQLAAEDDLSRRVVMLGLKGPHTPLIPDQIYLDMHPLNEITIPDGYDIPSSYMLRYLMADEASSLYNAGKLEEFVQYYLACKEEDDARLGEIIASLKAHSLWSRTNFAVWSDHSFALGNQNSASLPQGIYKKFKNFGTATCCFCIIRDPNYPNGANITEAVSAMDLGPTLLEMAGIAIPAAMEGQSLLPAIRRPTTWVNTRAAPSFCFGNISTVKSVTTPNGSKPVRLIKMFNGEELLYRDDTDPLNKTSLAADPDYATALSEAQAAMETELVRLGKTSTGTSGNNMFLQYAGGATLTGGAGDDVYVVGASDIVVTEGSGAGTDTMIIQYTDITDTTISIPANVEFVFIDPTMDAATITVAGTGGAHVIGGIASATGNTGDDTFVVSGSGGPGAVMYGGGGADKLDGTPNQSDTLYGGAGADTVRGASGDDTIDGGAGDNRLGGGGDDDSIVGGTDNDSIYGGSGADSIYGGGGLDLLQGDGGADLIYGGAGNDEVYGGQGTDTLYGEGGDDIFKTGRGTTVIYGGTGANILQVGFLTGTTTWMDYATGTGNKTRFLPGLGLGDLDVTAANLLTNVQNAGTDVGADFVLTIPDTGATITYIGKLEASFVEADFEVANFEEVDAPDEETSTDGG